MPVLDRSTTPVPKKQIGYFCHLEVETRHMGAVLVTDQIGVPVEFKYTEPVTATRLHRILYGASLERYLHETVIRERLGRDLRSEAEVFLTPYEEKDFLGSISGRPMVAVQQVPAAPTDMAEGSVLQVRDREAMVRLEEGPALRLSFSTPDDAVQRRVITWLQEISRTMDVLEPLDRIVRALKMLCGEGKKPTVTG